MDSNFQLKIADFGLAAIVSERSVLLQSYCGSNAYMAPEVFASEKYEGVYADLWSAACVLFVMLSGVQPFASPSPSDWWLKNILAGKYHRFWEAHVRSVPHLVKYVNTDHGLGAQDLINHMFVGDITHRYTIPEILDHDWMRGKIYETSELKSYMKDLMVQVQRVKEDEKRRKSQEKAKRLQQQQQQQRAGGNTNGYYVFERDTRRTLISNNNINIGTSDTADTPAVTENTPGKLSLPVITVDKLLDMTIYDTYCTLEVPHMLIVIEEFLSTFTNINYHINHDTCQLIIHHLEIPYTPTISNSSISANVSKEDGVVDNDDDNIPVPCIQGYISLYQYHEIHGVDHGYTPDTDSCIIIKCKNGIPVPMMGNNIIDKQIYPSSNVFVFHKWVQQLFAYINEMEILENNKWNSILQSKETLLHDNIGMV